MHAVHVAKVYIECTNIIHQHPGDNELEGHGSTKCGWIGQLTQNLKRILLPPYRPASQLWRNCPNSCPRHQIRIGLPYLYWPMSWLLRVSLSVQGRGLASGTHHMPPCGSICVKWDGKPTWRLEARLQELQEKKTTKRHPSRKITALVSVSV